MVTVMKCYYDFPWKWICHDMVVPLHAKAFMNNGKEEKDSFDFEKSFNININENVRVYSFSEFDNNGSKCGISLGIFFLRSNDKYHDIGVDPKCSSRKGRKKVEDKI